MDGLTPSTHRSNGAEDVFDELTNVESRFYAEGWQAGYDHGRLHGLFEGRELGREKGWEVWEEVGYMQGWAGFYVGWLERRGVVPGGRGKESRALNHAKLLLDLIAKFPTSNLSDLATTTIAPSSGEDVDVDTDADADTEMEAATPVPTPEADVDLPALLSSIRARYRLLCSSLGTRPRLTTASIPDSASGTSSVDVSAGGVELVAGVVQGIEGPMKGVDTRQLKF